MIKFRNYALERACGRERARVQFIDQKLSERPAAPTLIRPNERIRINHARRAMHATRLPTRDRIGPLLLVINNEKIVSARPHIGHDDLEDVSVAALHHDGLRRGVDNLYSQTFGARGPDAKQRAAITKRARAELQLPCSRVGFNGSHGSVTHVPTRLRATATARSRAATLYRSLRRAR